MLLYTPKSTTYAVKTVEGLDAVELLSPTSPHVISGLSDYTRDEIIQLIRATFPEEPARAVKVAECESSFLPDAYNPTNNSHDGGIFQVSLKYHGPELEALGLDRFDVRDNLTFARILYDRNGWRDWSASQHCWQ